MCIPNFKFLAQLWRRVMRATNSINEGKRLKNDFFEAGEGEGLVVVLNGAEK